MPRPVSTVDRYLAALPANDWGAVRGCLADDVVRFGPYNDDYRGRDSVPRVPASAIEPFRGYELVVDRIVTTVVPGAGAS